jgi:Glycosyl transferases group 1
MTKRQLRILVLSMFDGTNANVIRDFLFSFRAHSRHEYYYVFDCRILDEETDFAPFDVILVFWSIYLLGPDISESVRERIRKTSALKVLFLQDEYRDVRSINRIMSELGIQIMFTCVAEADHEVFYPKALIPSLEAVYTVIPGYVPTYLEGLAVDDRAARPLDIGYRSRETPYYLGDLGQEKRVVAERFEAIAAEQGFRADISVRERDRLYGRRWLDFLAASRCVLGSASGASVVDFTGEIRRGCEQYLSLRPNATYAEVKRHFFADVDWKVVIDTVSPRLFEAAAVHCTLVQHEGGYAGIIQPDHHYIMVRRDYSNVADVVAQMKDEAYCREIARNAYRDLIASGRYTYRAFAAEFDRTLDAHILTPAWRSSTSPVRFYARNFIRHNQAIIPYRDRFAMLPSRKLAGDVIRRGLAKLPRDRFGPVFSRLIENPGNFFTKAYLGARIALVVPALRALVRRYVTDRSLRREIAYHELMNDLVKLDVIRRARGGTLRARQPFEVTVGFHPESGVLMLTSVPPSPGDVETIGTGRAPSGLLEALREGRVTLIIWDHSAFSLQIVYAPIGSEWVTIGVGMGGIHRFETLTRLARRHPEAAASILVPLLAGRVQEDP